MVLPGTSLVLGGAASGKSVFAESLVLRACERPVYLATAQALDAEMKAKIALHQARRGPEWRNVDAGSDLREKIGALKAGDHCLLDCVTMWLSGVLMSGADIAIAQKQLLAAITSCKARLVIVSNEVGGGIVPENALARQFREAQGRLNIALAAEADLVVQVVAGLPRALKGGMP